MLRRRFILVLPLLIGCHTAAGTAPETPATTAPSAPTSPRAATVAVAATAAVAAATAAVSATATAPAPPAPPSTFVVRYACDDKYDEDTACRPGNRAWDTWLSGIQLSTASPNLLARNGGGPSGAEWNPNAPLVVFVAMADAGRALLKAGRTTFRPVARFGDYDVFLMPFKAWRAAVGPATGPFSAVDLRALGPQGELGRGVFLFADGE